MNFIQKIKIKIKIKMGSIIQERGNEFEYYCRALEGQYNNNISALVHDCNKELFQARKTQTESWFKAIPHKKIQTGFFYLINYNYIDDVSGKVSNNLYAPLFIIDYRVRNNKHILYAINLDYLPISFKKAFLQQLYDKARQIFDKNDESRTVLDEQKISVSFESMYNILKGASMNYCISAYDVTKIQEVYAISTGNMYILTYAHMRPINVALLKMKMSQYDRGSEITEKLEKIITELEDLTELAENDVIEYYKKLKSLENNYKLFENP